MIGTLTFHRTTNYGAMFQTYALQKALLNLGIESRVIDYRSEIFEKRYESNKLKDLLNLRHTYRLLRNNSYIRDNRKSFWKFSDAHIRKSKRLYNESNIHTANEEFDFFITGSDQVWNPNCMGWDENFFLKFANPEKISSYAASFGFSECERNVAEWIKPLLKRFRVISVREMSGVKICKEIVNKDAFLALDPTLLLDKCQWQNLADSIKFKKSYILLYLLSEDPEIFKIAESLSRQKGLPIIYINDRLLPHNGVHNKFYVTPGEWLSYFLNASCVITNSFHGTIFSINFNKDFYVKLLPSSSKVNARLIDILALFNLQDRLLDNNHIAEQKIDFEKVNEKLINLRAESLAYLQNIVNRDN